MASDPIDRSQLTEQLRDSFYEELDVVFRRHNELINYDPAMATALVINMADTLRDKFNVAIDVNEFDDHDGIAIICGDQEAAAFLGFDRNQDTGGLVEADLPEEVDFDGD